MDSCLSVLQSHQNLLNLLGVFQICISVKIAIRRSESSPTLMLVSSQHLFHSLTFFQHRLVFNQMSFYHGVLHWDPYSPVFTGNVCFVILLFLLVCFCLFVNKRSKTGSVCLFLFFLSFEKNMKKSLNHNFYVLETVQRRT